MRFTGYCSRVNIPAMSASLSPAGTLAANAAVPTADSGAALRRTRSGQWLMVIGGVLLGTLGVFVQEAAQDPFTTVWFRCAFGGAALLAWGAATGRLGELRLHGRGWLAALAAGLLVVLNWALFFGAIHRTSIAVATVVFHVQPLWVMLLGAILLRERVLPAQWLAGLVALAGVVLASGLSDEWLSGTGRLDSAYVLGLAMCLGGSFSYAVVTLIAKSTRSVTPFALAWWQCAVGCLLLAWWPLVHGWPAIGPAWAWLAGLGIIHTGLAYVVLYTGMARLASGQVAVLQFVYPGAAVLVDWLVYGRALGTGQLLGVALMAGALWVVRVRAPRAAA